MGIDDTDSPRGGCTTWVLTELLALARELHVDLVGQPRLVRLNPNIPWKTRGNAALSARFGRGRGPRSRVGWIGGKEMYACARGRPLGPTERSRFLEAAWARVLAGSRLGDPHTDPAMVATDRPLPSSLYWSAVREVVDPAEVRRSLDVAGAWYRTHGSDRGLVGAAASIAWPGRRATWELTAYRRADRIGLPRHVDAESVRRAAMRHPSLFLCHDPRTRRVLVAPHTPCPILFGLRSTARSALPRALKTVRSEPADRWVLFRTNQASGDHLVFRTASEIGPYLSARLRCTVAARPEARRGGHVRFRVRDDAGTELECLAFEPTKTLPTVAARLVPGDRLVLWGSRGTTPVFRVEGIRLTGLAPRYGPTARPTCPACGRGTRSLGLGRGYRCPSCRHRLPPEAAARPRLRAPLARGEYHPTPSARRHLAPPGPERADRRATESF